MKGKRTPLRSLGSTFFIVDQVGAFSLVYVTAKRTRSGERISISINIIIIYLIFKRARSEPNIKIILAQHQNKRLNLLFTTIAYLK